MYFLERTPSETLLQLKDIMLNVIAESEYNAIVKDYKKQPFENEHNQVVRWCALIRIFFHRRQVTHSHHTTDKMKTLKGKVYSNKKRKLLSLGKLSGSFDNIKDAKVKEIAVINKEITTLYKSIGGMVTIPGFTGMDTVYWEMFALFIFCE